MAYQYHINLHKLAVRMQHKRHPLASRGFRWLLAPFRKPVPQEDQVRGVLLAMRDDLHTPKQTWRGERDRHTLDLADHHILGGLFVLDAPSRTHEIHQNLICHTNHVKLLRSE